MSKPAAVSRFNHPLFAVEPQFLHSLALLLKVKAVTDDTPSK
jgi:hypothetical protein